ncbi:MAG: T9SS type A sorting domain-containing protein [Bacteroidota bacterium]
MRKKLTLLMFFIVACSMTMQTQTIPNGDFENWSQDTLYEDPQDYLTLNFQSAVMGSPPGATKTTDSYSGNYALKLTTRKINGEIIPGLLTTGNLNNFEQGVPYTDKPDSIFLNVKENLAPGDTASAFIMFTAMSNTIGMAQINFSDSATSYQTYSKEINWYIPSLTPDSATLVIMTTGFMENASPGSNIIVDNISFGSGYADLPNNDFENWNIKTSEKPDSWLSSNALTDASSPSVEKSNDSYSGNYAAKITSSLTFTNDTMGFLTNGRAGVTMASEGGYYVWKNPDMLSGYYKYSPDGPDSAFVSVYSYSKNQNNDLILVESNVVKLPQANNYTLFEVPLNYNDWPIVDTVNISFGSGNFIGQNSYTGLGSELYIDDLSMAYKTTSIEESKDNPLKIAPNPAQGKVLIDLAQNKFHELKIISIDGQLLENINIKGKNQITLNTNEYPRGMVLLKFTGNNASMTKKLILQ